MAESIKVLLGAELKKGVTADLNAQIKVIQKQLNSIQLNVSYDKQFQQLKNQINQLAANNGLNNMFKAPVSDSKKLTQSVDGLNKKLKVVSRSIKINVDTNNAVGKIERLTNKIGNISVVTKSRKNSNGTWDVVAKTETENFEKLNRLRDSQNAKNANIYDQEIKKREQDAKRNSELLKRQMEQRERDNKKNLEYEQKVANLRRQLAVSIPDKAARFKSSYSGHYNENELKRILDYNTRIRNIVNKFPNDYRRINNEIQLMNKELRAFETQTRLARNQMNSLGQSTFSVGEHLKRFAQFYILGDVFALGKRAIREMVRTVIDLDNAMIGLQKVTNETEETYSRFVETASQSAFKLGSTTKDVIEATTEFAKMGYSMEEAKKIGETAIVYTKVGDVVDAKTASQTLISTMKAFGIQAKDSIRIIDILNEVSNNFSISSDGIGEALKRSAASMYEANNTLEQTVALITAANTITQDPEVVGQAMKTLSMRLRGNILRPMYTEMCA